MMRPLLIVSSVGALACGSSEHCDVEKFAFRDVADLDAINCGVFHDLDRLVEDPQFPELVEGRDCLLEAYEASRSFVIAWDANGIDTGVAAAWVGVNDAAGYRVRFYGGELAVTRQDCAELATVPDCVENVNFLVGSLCLECRSPTSDRVCTASE